jgi:PTH1 family peptidyl-tRNA hydrolase
MWLFVGLGNPEPRFKFNRHNVGFHAVEAIHDRYGFEPWRRGHDAAVAEGEIADHEVLALKPDTFMNASGRAVARAQKSLKVALGDVVVFHEEIELPFGRVRAKVGGGDRGHNGLRSISSACGSDYVRVRIGVGRPDQKHLVESHVLSNFAPAEQVWVKTICDEISRAIELILARDIDSFQKKLELALAAAGISPRKSPPGEVGL